MMTNGDRINPPEEAPPFAGLGLLRPPVVYLTATVVGVAIHYARPVPLVPPALAAPLGIAAILGAIALFLASFRTFQAAGTPVPGDQPTTAIVRKGPYRFSRNPIYLAFSLLLIGIALWVNSVWLLVTLVPAVMVMSLVVIPREEAYLEARFPSEYLPYKASVRRWL